jgi:hypothetical protein
MIAVRKIEADATQQILAQDPKIMHNISTVKNIHLSN